MMSKFKVCAAAAVAFNVLSISALGQVPAAPVPASEVAPAAPVEKVIATVGTDTITNTQVEAISRGQLRGRQASPEALTNLRIMILESLIRSRLVAQYVAAKKITVDAKEVEEALASIKKRLAEAEIDFATVMKAQGLTAETLKEQIASELAIKKYAEAEVTDEKAETYFKANKQEFDGTEVKASHILLKYEPQSTAEEKKAANDKIATIKQEILAGADFAEAAKKHSACPSSDKGGDLGFFKRGQMVKPFSDTAFGMTAGQMSEPVETQFGVHLIKVTEVKPGETNFDAAKDAVKDVLIRQLMEETAAEQRKVTKVEILN
ncbi:MAG: peptidylprolyl isomerase [Planctomycetes bacterium]|nr:peptidylprolyl isomerase [Planctomycetota bacterium]